MRCFNAASFNVTQGRVSEAPNICVYEYFAITKYHVYSKAKSLAHIRYYCSQNIMGVLFVPKQQTNTTTAGGPGFIICTHVGLFTVIS